MPNSTTVLVVDDDASTQGLLAAIVKHVGLTPLAAGDGGEALTIIESENPAAIILDLLMPEVDGFHVLRQLKAKAPDLLRPRSVVAAVNDGGRRRVTAPPFPGARRQRLR